MRYHHKMKHFLLLHTYVSVRTFNDVYESQRVQYLCFEKQLEYFFRSHSISILITDSDCMWYAPEAYALRTAYVRTTYSTHVHARACILADQD